MRQRCVRLCRADAANTLPNRLKKLVKFGQALLAHKHAHDFDAFSPRAHGEAVAHAAIGYAAAIIAESVKGVNVVDAKLAAQHRV